MTLTLLFAAVVAALGGLLFGFDTAVIAGATSSLQREFGLDAFSLGFTVASALIGTILGSIAVGRPADRLGRRGTLFVIASIYLVSALGCAWAWSWPSLLCFRLLGGLAIGGASVVSPMYIAEISPARLRGRLVAITQLSIVVGILAAFFSNYVIAEIGFGASAWRWMLGVAAAPSAAFFALLFFVPESPRWLLAGGRIQDATAVLTRLGTAREKLDADIAAIRESLDADRQGVDEPFFSRRYARPIGLAVAIAMFNQLSGINALMYYAPRIFQLAGAGERSALLQTVAVGGTNLLFTVLALSIIDHFGRRRLMLVGSVGYIISLTVTAMAFYTGDANPDSSRGVVVLCGLLLFIAAHAFGQGAVIWVFISEIFPTRVRARGQALGSFTHWIMAAAISWSFPMIAQRSGGHAFAFYAVCAVGQLIWVLRVMPETKGVSLEQIQKQLGIE